MGRIERVRVRGFLDAAIKSHSRVCAPDDKGGREPHLFAITKVSYNVGGLPQYV